jgi:NAD(P)-dependent dehydrogenase (short-subunit alcohol dehydrogenase family)
MNLPLEGKRVLITGVGVRYLGCQFTDFEGDPTQLQIYEDPIFYKANIGTACALACIHLGATVHLVSRTKKKLQIVQKWLQRETSKYAEFTAVDVTDRRALEFLVGRIPRDGMPLYWVQSVGIGGGTVRLLDDNPYMRVEEITPALMQAELSIVQSTIDLLQLLLPRFRQQTDTRVCIITSMSAIRSVWSGSAHMAAKGALSRWANAASIELDPERIHITDVRPGAVDTGLYDPDEVQARVIEMMRRYDYDWSPQGGGMKLIPPTDVGEMVAHILSMRSHVTSVNIVGRGQPPHEGS